MKSRGRTFNREDAKSVKNGGYFGTSWRRNSRWRLVAASAREKYNALCRQQPVVASCRNRVQWARSKGSIAENGREEKEDS
jgi:hypothetical protein